MKFWELISAFREEPKIIRQVLKQKKWKTYYAQYKRFPDIVRQQNRDILDEELPFDLCYEIAVKSNKEYWLSFQETPQVLYNYRPDIEDLERLLPVEILVRFGGSKIEDAHEYSYTNVEPRKLNGHAEVIGSYDMPSVGLLFVLRTDIEKLQDNCILSTLDNSTKWRVKGEDKTWVDPFSAWEKLWAQKKQNIVYYLVDGMGHHEKAKPAEFLRILQA